MKVLFDLVRFSVALIEKFEMVLERGPALNVTELDTELVHAAVPDPIDGEVVTETCWEGEWLSESVSDGEEDWDVSGVADHVLDGTVDGEGDSVQVSVGDTVRVRVADRLLRDSVSVNVSDSVVLREGLVWLLLSVSVSVADSVIVAPVIDRSSDMDSVIVSVFVVETPDVCDSLDVRISDTDNVCVGFESDLEAL